MLLVCLAGSPASGQTVAQREKLPPEFLRLNAAAGAGYDANILGTSGAVINPTVPQHGTYTSADVSLDYMKRTTALTASASGSSSFRLYQTDQKLTTQDYGGGISIAGQMSSRFHLSGGAGAHHASQYVFYLFPDLVSEPVPALAPLITAPHPPPSQDFSLSPVGVDSYSGSLTGQFAVTRRAQLSGEYGVGRSKFGGSMQDFNSQYFGGHFSYGLTRYAALRVGYSAYTSKFTTVPSTITTVPSTITGRTMDIGITYSRPLSFSRRTRFSFSTSSLAVDDGIQRYSTVGGSAVLTHEISRNWSANLSADRGISLLSGFHDPFLANGVNGALEGTFGGRFHFTSSAGYSGGNIGVARAIFHNYTSSMASARLEVELVRRLSAYTEYAFYKYRFDQQVLLPNGTPQQLDRNGVRVGVSYMVPLLRERTNSATR